MTFESFSLSCIERISFSVNIQFEFIWEQQHRSFLSQGDT
ncbi:hypothetical protein KPSA1_06422 [Pseudomonas syringae pv. actinidiae]|uniref:Uncharacterized protein n=1 Tax=Pseudomonas syringae pv. actinidiae TaxID=103796 RepID=A0A2V0QIK4_PSESF|nr:hypothetical protein KPSA1_06422 [Pseudomonas syringae pv. actinidiae]